MCCIIWTIEMNMKIKQDMI